MEIIKIKTPFIQLQQLLKFADVVEEGADAKILIQEGYVTLNGETETRRGKKIYPGDEVLISYDWQKISLKVDGENI